MMPRRRRLDALLIAVGSPHPTAARAGAVAGIPPLGIAYVASVLRRAGLSIRIADLNVPGWTRRRMERCLRLQRPAVVGLSASTESYRNALRLAGWIRTIDPAARIVAGGPHVTFEDAAALRTGVVDVVVRGEGEQTAAELFPRLAAGEAPGEGIAGISYRGPEGIVRAAPRARIADLDTIPFPARDLLPLERYGSPGAVLTGRGCPGNCPFCSASAMSGGRRRVRDPRAVLDEIVSLRRSGIDEITFLDDTLTGDRGRLDTLLDGIERSRVRIGWTCESRIESVDPALLRRMGRLGCHGIQFGIESASERSQSLLGKRAVGARIDRVLEATRRAGITPVCTFILGLPWEDADAVGATIDLGLSIQRRYLARVGFGLLVCFPGTRFYSRGSRLGLRRRTGDFDRYTMHIPTCSTRHLDLDALRSLHFEAVLAQIRETPRALIELSPQSHWWAERLVPAGPSVRESRVVGPDRKERSDGKEDSRRGPGGDP